MNSFRGLLVKFVIEIQSATDLAVADTVVDGQIFVGLDLVSFDKEGIDFELVKRNTGHEIFELLARG